MSSAVDEPERGDEGFLREALPAVEAWNVARDFTAIMHWQISGQVAGWIAHHWERHGLETGDGEVFEVRVGRLFEQLWKPVKPPRGGWGSWRR